MNTKLIATLLVFTALGWGALVVPAQAQAPTPTPAYDPLGEPPLPKHPTQLETGRHLYWRHCMPCHGDAGQGLTPQFLALWEEHQNCWERGCHSGRQNDEGFPIPTAVPALAHTGLLERYAPDSLFAYLRATHPPQDPGLLSDDDYRALVAFLYFLNDRPLPAATATPEPTPTDAPASFTPTPRGVQPPEADSPFGPWPLIILAVILTVLVLLRDNGGAK
ncbi:MAG: c-type cytochrome [Chloroflexota bacterium]